MFRPAGETSKSTSAVKSLNACKCGKGRLVQFYCLGDEDLTCKPCRYENHPRCNVENILQISRGILDKTEFRQMTKELKILRNVFIKLQENKHLGQMKSRQEQRSKPSLLKHFPNHGRSSVTEDRNRHSMHLPVKEVERRNASMVEHTDKINGTIEIIDVYLKELTECILAHNEVGAFIAYHRAKLDLAQFHHFLNVLNDEKTHPNLQSNMTNGYVQENKGCVKLSRAPKATIKLPSLLDNQISYMNRREEKPDLRIPEENVKRRPREPRLSSGKTRFRPLFRPQCIRMATMLSSIKGGSRASFSKVGPFAKKRASQIKPEEFTICSKEQDGESNGNHVTSMAKLRDGRFILLDARWNKIKLFASDNRYICEMSMHSSIWDCCVVGNIVFVTCPAEGKIQKVQVTTNNLLYEIGVILTQKDCKAICFHNHRIYITITGLCPCIKILSTDGIMRKSIAARQGKLHIFQNPMYMHVSKNGSAIYLSDFTLQRLTVIDRTGNLLHVFDVSPNWPLGLTTDTDDNVILVVTGENDIRIVTSEGSRMKTLISSKILNGDPSSVMCKQAFEGQSVYIAFSGQDTVKVFKLSY